MRRERMIQKRMIDLKRRGRLGRGKEDRSEEERKITEEEMGRIEGEGKVRKRRTEPKIDLKNRKSIV